MKTKLAAFVASTLITLGAWAAEEPSKPAAAVSSLSSIKMEMGKDLSSSIWKMTNRAQGVSGQIQDVITQIDKTIEVTPKA